MHYMVKEATRGHSLIKVVSDNTDVPIFLAHHVYFRTNDIPNSVHVIMESNTRDRSVIDVNEIIKYCSVEELYIISLLLHTRWGVVILSQVLQVSENPLSWKNWQAMAMNLF